MEKRAGRVIGVWLLIFLSSVAQAQSSPVPLSLKFCLPAYGERLGSIAALTARDLGYFDRENLDVKILVTKTPVLKELEAGRCDSGLVSVHELAALGKNGLKKWRPGFYMMNAEGGGPRIIVNLGSEFRDFKLLAGKTIRAADRFEAEAVEKQFAGLGLRKPRMVIQPDPSLIPGDLSAGKIHGAVVSDPMGAGMLSTLKYWFLPSETPGMSDAETTETPATFLIAPAKRYGDPALNAFYKAYAYAFNYLDLNPSESLRIAQKNRELLGLQLAPLGPVRLPYTVRFFQWPQLRPPAGKQEPPKILKALKTARPEIHDWLKEL